MIRNKSKEIYVYLFLVFTALFIYAINDVQTSANTGFKESIRLNVYVFLVAVIFLMFAYNTTRTFIKISFTPITKSMWLLIIWIIMVDISNSANIWNVAIHVGLAFLWIMSYGFFYLYLTKHPDSRRSILFYFMIMFIFYIAITVYASFNIQSLYNSDHAVLNYSYYIIVFIPFLYFLESKKWRFIFLAVAIGLVIYSLKRGAIITLPLMLIANIWTDAKISNKKFSSSIKIILLLILIVCAFFIMDSVTGGFLSSRFSLTALEDGSGRNLLWKDAISNISQRNLAQFLIGMGSGSSVALLGTGVHDEWLEFLFSFGFIGVLFYAGILISIFRRYLSLLKQSSRYASVYVMPLVYMFVVGLFGGIYFVHSTFYVFSCLGIIEGLIARERIGNIEESRHINI